MGGGAAGGRGHLLDRHDHRLSRAHIRPLDVSAQPIVHRHRLSRAHIRPLDVTAQPLVHRHRLSRAHIRPLGVSAHDAARFFAHMRCLRLKLLRFVLSFFNLTVSLRKGIT